MLWLKNSRKIRLWLLGLASILGLAMLFAAPIVRMVLSNSQAWFGYTVTAKHISGTVFSPKLQEVTVSGKGLKLTANKLNITASIPELFSRKAKLSLQLKNANIQLDLAELLSASTPQSNNPWKLELTKLDMQQVKLNIKGEDWGIPNMYITAQSISPHTVGITATSTEGTLQGSLDIQPQVVARIERMDARMLRYYYKGIEAGIITGEYQFKNGVPQGKLQISGAKVAVDGASWLKINDVSGNMQQVGESITSTLSGRGLGSVVTAHTTVHTSKKVWNSKLDATPQLQYLPVQGLSGKGKLSLHAYGWDKVQVDAQYAGSADFGEVSSDNLKVQYRLNPEQTMKLTAQGMANIVGEQLQLYASSQGTPNNMQGEVNFKNAHLKAQATFEGWDMAQGTANARAIVTGDFLNWQDIAATAQLSHQSVVQLSAQADTTLHEPVKVRAALSGKLQDMQGTASINGKTTALNAKISSLSGDFSRLRSSLSGKATVAGTKIALTETALSKTAENYQLAARLAVDVLGKPRDIQLNSQGTLEALSGTASTVLDGVRIKAQFGALNILSGKINPRVDVTASGAYETLKNIKLQALLDPQQKVSIQAGADAQDFHLKADLRGDVQALSGRVNATGTNTLLNANIQKLSTDFTELQAVLSGEMQGLKAVNLKLSKMGEMYSAAGTAKTTLSGEDFAVGLQANGTPEDINSTLTLANSNHQLTARTTHANLLKPNISGTLQGSMTLSGMQAQNVAGVWGISGETLSGKVSADVQVQQENIAMEAVLQGTLTQPQLTVSGLGEHVDVRALLNKGMVSWQGKYQELNTSGTYALASQKVQGQLQGSFAGSEVSGSVSGTIQNLKISVPQAKIKTAAGILDAAGQGSWKNGVLRYHSALLDVQYQTGIGNFRIKNATLSGVMVNASGVLLGNKISGTLSTDVPQLGMLEGAYSFDTKEGLGNWQTQYGTVRLDGAKLRAMLRNIPVWGSEKLHLDVTYQDKLTGTVQLTGEHSNLKATVQDMNATVSGTLYNTTLTGTANSSSVVVTWGQLRLNAENHNAAWQAEIWSKDQRLNLSEQGAMGTLDVSALGEMLGVAVSGTVQSNLQPEQGTLTLNLQAFDTRVTGKLDWDGKTLTTAQVIAQHPQLKAELSGQLYPSVGITAQSDTLNATVAGNYGNIRYTVQGTTPELASSLATLPAQKLRLQGNLTPSITARGFWGRLNIGEKLGMYTFSGAVPVLVQGAETVLNITSTVGSDFSGRMDASLETQNFKINLHGPWKNMLWAARYTHQDDTVQVSGVLNAPEQGYQLKASGKIAGISLESVLQGQGTALTGSSELRSSQGGTVNISSQSWQEHVLQAQNFSYQGTNISGTAEYKNVLNGTFSGEYQGSPFTLTARDNSINFTANHPSVKISAQTNLNTTQSKIEAFSPYGSAFLTGTWQSLTGMLYLKKFEQANFSVPEQQFALNASVLNPSVSLGNLAWQGGQFTGDVPIVYQWAKTGEIRLTGSGETLGFVATGELAGQGQIYPQLGGDVVAQLAALQGYIPENLTLKALKVKVSDDVVSLYADGLYQKENLTLSARGSITEQTLQGSLEHPKAHIPFDARASGLSVLGANVDAAVLGEGFTGTSTLDVNIPDWDIKQATGLVSLNVLQDAQNITGKITAKQGKIQSQLSGNIQDRALTVSGEVYPQTQLKLRFDAATGTVQGSTGRYNAQLKGKIAGQNVALQANSSGEQLNLQGKVASTDLSLLLNVLTGQGAAELAVGKLSDFVDVTGSAKVQIALDSYQHTTAQLNAEVSGQTLQATGLWSDSTLTVKGKSTSSVLNSEFSGSVLPELNVTVSGETFIPKSSFAANITPESAALTGQVLSDYQGLGIAYTQFTALYQQGKTQISSKGAVTAEAELQGTELKNLTAVLNIPVQREDVVATVSGNVAWSPEVGFAGNSSFSGSVLDEAVRLDFSGHNDLLLQGTALGGTVQAELNKNISELSLQVQSLDVGRLYHKPEALLLNSNVKLRDGVAVLAGNLTNAKSIPYTQFSGKYQNDKLDVKLSGKNITGAVSGMLSNLKASLRIQDIELAPLLPIAAQSVYVQHLEVTAQAQPLSLELKNSEMVGKIYDQHFVLQGDMHYSPQKLGGNIKATLGNGTFSAQGNLPEAVSINAQNLTWNNYMLSGTAQLKGSISNPQIQGNITMQHPELTATGKLSGTLERPSISAQGTLSGKQTGTWSGTANINTRDPSAEVVLDGKIQQGGSVLQVALSGITPNLQGEVSVSGLSIPLSLKARGDGVYTLQGSEGLSGEIKLSGTGIPNISGQLQFSPKGIAGVQGQGSVNLDLHGTLSDPQYTLSGEVSDVSYQGVTVPVTVFSGKGALLKPSVRLSQKTGFALWENNRITAENFGVQALNSVLELSGSGTLEDFKAQIRSTGDLKGTASVQYSPQKIQLQYSALYGTYSSKGDVGYNGTAWLGSGEIAGIPQVGTLNYRVQGAKPEMISRVAVGGIFANINASQQQLKVSLESGENQASGTLIYDFDVWNGDLSYSSSVVSVQASAKQQKTLNVVATREKASLQAALALNPVQVLGTLSDGEHSSGFVYSGGEWNTEIKTFNLQSLGEKAWQGTAQLSAQGTGNTAKAVLKLSDVSSEITVPFLDVPLSGNIDAVLQTEGSNIQVLGQYQGALGTASFNAANPNGVWAAQSNFALSETRGKLYGNVRLQNGELNGQVNAETFVLRYGDSTATVSGKVLLKEQNFDANVTAEMSGGSVKMVGDGSVSDLFPVLKQYGLKETPEGDYQIAITASAVSLSGLQLAPYLRGKLYGNAALSAGVSTFNVRVPDLNMAGELLPTRLEGNFDGDRNIRFKGNVGDSTITGSSNDGEIAARVDFKATPLHAFFGMFSGALPGKAQMTGVARVSGKLSDFKSLSAIVVAENITAASCLNYIKDTPCKQTDPKQTLTGTGELFLKQGKVSIPEIKLTGAGQWYISGEYSPEKVDMTAEFSDTVFTPFLVFFPELENLNPSLQGSLSLRATGDGLEPKVSIVSPRLKATFGNNELESKNVTAQLANQKWQASAELNALGTVYGKLNFTASGELSQKLENSLVQITGSLGSEALGLFERINSTITQQGNTWLMLASAEQGGKIEASGTLSPTLALSVRAANITPDLRKFYVQKAILSGGFDIFQVGEEFHVSGIADIVRLQLTFSSTDQDKTQSEFAFNSPLPVEYTTFPQKRVDRDRSGLSNWVFDNVQIRARNSVRIDENLARAEFDGDLLLAGTAYQPTLSGTLASARGSLFIRENEFVLQPSGIVFSAVDGVYPTVTLNGVGTVSGVPIAVKVSGSFQDKANPATLGEKQLALSTSLSCNNSTTCSTYSEDSLYALLLFGTTDVTKIPSQLGSSALRTTLDVFLLGELGRSLASAFGIDVFKIRTLNLDTPENFNAEFTFGSYITREFYLQYQVNLKGSGVLNAEYNTLDGRLSFQVSSPIEGLDFNSFLPSLTMLYNFTDRRSVFLGVTSNDDSTTTYRLGFKFRF